MESEIMKAVEKKEDGVSKMLMGASIQITENNGVLAEDVNVENPRNPPKKKKRGADGEIVKASLISPENNVSKLRPRKSVSSFRKVELNESDFERIVGKRVKVYWSGSRRWFTGCIKSFDNVKKLHRILYDDGDKEDLDLKKERFELEVLSTESFKLYYESGSMKKESNLDGGEVKERREKDGLHAYSKLRPRKLVPSFQNVELNESDFERIVGKRVKVYWPDSRKWFVGCIKSFDNDSKLHRILYDDGDKEDLDLKSERFELEVMSTEAFNLGSNHKKKERRSYGGELKKEMIESGLLNTGDVGHVKKHSKENITASEKIDLKLHEGEATQNRVFLKEKLHEEKSTKVKAGDVTSKVESVVHEESSKDQVPCIGVKFVKYSGDLRSQNRGQSVSEMPNGNPKNHVKNNVQPEEKNVDKPPTKRKKGADGDTTVAVLSSSKDIPTSKLRPRKSIPSFREVELNESDFRRIVGKRVKVYWPDSRKWFTGCIKSFDSKKKLHKILYDDGESEDLNLKGERFELEVMTGEPFNLCFKSRPNPKKTIMTSDGCMVNEELIESGSLDVVNVGHVKKNALMSGKPISKATRKGRLQLHHGKGTVKKQDMDREIEIIVPADNNNDQVTCSKKAYWQMYVPEV